MTKADIREIVAACLQQKRVCRVYLRYDINYWYYIPLIVGDKLFLGTEEDDFILDGYTVRRFKDVTKAQFRDDMCEKILKDEGVLDNIVTPEVDLSDWEAVFRSLQKRNKNIIIQRESLNKRECEYVIGRIEKVYKQHAYFRPFDADGIWEPEPYRIPYTEVTSITFAARYVDVFSKYLGELPDNFGK